MSAYGTDESRILGHLDVSPSEADWSSLMVCPSRYSNQVQDKHLIFSGSPNLSFTVQIDSSPLEIKLNESKTVRVTPENVQVFQFFPPEDIAKTCTQLDVTVTSESGDVPAYLKVSRVCKEVDKDNIDEVDYKGESIRLSFSKKGQITLSKVSVPPFADSTSSWFIGIAIKNATGDTPFNATKSVTLELNRSFDFSYGYPIALLVVSSIVFGLVISVLAFRTFTKRHCRCKAEKPKESAETRPLTNITETASTNVQLTISNWYQNGPKTYSFTTAIVGFMLMIGAGQFVFANWHLMKEEGDRDNCYYNDFCYRVSKWHDIPLNLMISNVVYIIHGVILGASVLLWEWDERVSKTNVSEQEEQIFSIGYAFAWAMIFEGLFSLVYHLCPCKLPFQFDTAFMFVIAGLIVISLYNGTATNPVKAVHFFLCFLVPLFIFNYLGAVRHSQTVLPTPLQIPLYIALAVWFVLIVFWVRLKLFYTPQRFEGNNVRKNILFAVGIVLPVFFFGIGLSDLPRVFLFSCITESVLAILSPCKCPPCECSTCKCPTCQCPICQCSTSECPTCDCQCLVCKVLYVVAMGLLWGISLSSLPPGGG